MHLSTQHLQSLYEAYCRTHLLWENNDINTLEQFHLTENYDRLFLRKLNKQLRLGQLAEQFVFNQMETFKTISILAENIQIQKEKRTLGELDALLIVDNTPVHIEIVYKFYLYDVTLGDAEIDRWIGPNRKDSLKEKLHKLEQKQLPLLYSDACKIILKQLQLHRHSFVQQVLFKAQLFVPYQQEVNFERLNTACICGFYIDTLQLETFKNNQFHIPKKLDWFLKPSDTIDWHDFSSFKIETKESISNQQSPLFWMKSTTGELTKGFLIWW